MSYGVVVGLCLLTVPVCLVSSAECISQSGRRMAINTVPRELAGMASATTTLLRDLGFALGPVLGPAQGIFEAGGPFA